MFHPVPGGTERNNRPNPSLPFNWTWRSVESSGVNPSLAGGVFLSHRRLRQLPNLVMKRATSLSLLLSRDTPWLKWWQELILNWVASWSTIGDLTVSSADGEEYTAWELPSDLDLKRLELEELLSTPESR